MEHWAEIRRRILVNRESKRSILNEFGIHWKTLQKILEAPEPAGYQRRQPRTRPKLGPFLPVIEEILQHDQQAPRKQRHTAQRIFERLRAEHSYPGGLSVVKDVVRAWHTGHHEVFLPLSHPPGEAQVDFGQAEVLLGGQQTKVAFFVMTLPYSDALFCQVFPRECTEAFLAGHQRAFEFFGGAPRRISYDNLKIAVAKIVGSRERVVTREFLRLRSHYLFEPHFCLVRRPNEKGHVERLLDYARAHFLVPVPAIERLETLNATLAACCRQDLERQVREKPLPKAQLLAEEQARLLPLPAQAFEARRVAQATASSLALVRFDGNAYSVPTAHAHQPVTIVAGIDEVRLVVANRLVATHPRHWGKEHTSYNPLHYLALLERKPGGLDFARPLEGWNLPACFDVLRRRLETDLAGRGPREFIKVLRLLEAASVPVLADAVDYALGIGAISADAVRVIIEHRQEQPVGLFCLDGWPQLKAVQVPAPDLHAYRVLVQEGPL